MLTLPGGAQPQAPGAHGAAAEMAGEGGAQWPLSVLGLQQTVNELTPRELGFIALPR